MTPLEEYQTLSPMNWDKLPKVPAIGKKLKLSGHVEEADACFKTSVKGLSRLIKTGHIEDALRLESGIYDAFVKTTETEEHYFDCFKLWSDDLKKLGYAHRKPLKPGNPRKICFVLHNGVLLGHTNVLFTLVDEWLRQGIECELYLAALQVMTPGFKSLLEKRGIKIINDPRLQLGEACFFLRDEIERLNINTAVWMSAPITVSFAFAMKLAHRQVLWSVKFHPVYFKPREVIVQPIMMIQ